MFSYFQIARWLSFPVDPVSVEDWVANREVFGLGKPDSGEEEEQLELAYQIELARAGKLEGERKQLPLSVLLNGFEVGNTVEGADYLVVAPTGKVGKGNKRTAMELTVSFNKEKQRKVEVLEGEVLAVGATKEQETKLTVRCFGLLRLFGRRDWKWEGAGKRVLVFDGRGRPLPQYEPGTGTREIMGNIRQQLREAV